MSMEYAWRLTPLYLAVAGICGIVLAADEVQFNRDIRPILSENCFSCHGPDAKHREADLRLDVREAATEKRDHGAAIVPSKSAESQLVVRITSTDADLRMPPAESGRTITPEQVA